MRAGRHPHMKADDIKNKFGIADQVKRVFEATLVINPDLKAKSLLTYITKKRRATEILMKSNQIELLKDSNFIPVLEPDPIFIFSKHILPTLKQIILFS